MNNLFDTLLQHGFHRENDKIVFKNDKGSVVVSIGNRSVFTYVPEGTFSTHSVFGNVGIVNDNDIIEAVKTAIKLIS